MRVKLAEKLQNPAENIQPSTDIFKHRVMVSAVKDFLDKIGCNYTSSIFCS